MFQPSQNNNKDRVQRRKKAPICSNLNVSLHIYIETSEAKKIYEH